MKKESELIEEFSAMGFRFALSLKDGTYYEGYILEIDEKSFKFGLGGPGGSVIDPITIHYDQLDFNSLSFFQAKKHSFSLEGLKNGEWKNAQWDEEEEKWIITIL